MDDTDTNVWRVTELNVDGCGGSATEFVQFDASIAGHYETFKRCLTDAKSDAAEYGDDSDTADMVVEALELFRQRTGIAGRLCPPPYDGGFEF